MPLNKPLTYIHRFFIAFYLLLLLAMLLTYALGYLHNFSLTTIALMSVIYAGLAFLHFKTAVDVAKGTNKGRALSVILSCITLLLFPIGTLIGAGMLFLLSPKCWQESR